jgi:hypothetical protein
MQNLRDDGKNQLFSMSSSERAMMSTLLIGGLLTHAGVQVAGNLKTGGKIVKY